MALIGNPITQSPSYYTHNRVIDTLKENLVYLRLQLEKDELPEFFRLVKTLPFVGLSVTVPFKRNDIRILG